MKLLLTDAELDELIEAGFVSPNLSGFELIITSMVGKTRTIEVATESSLNQTTPATSIKFTKPSSTNGHSNIDDWIDSWRAGWKGTRVKGMGSREKCVQNMQEFFQLYPQFTQDNVFKARDRYIQSLEGNFTYLEQADYFIKKRVPSNDGGIETRRTLLVYCEELVIDEELGIEDAFNLYEDIN